MHRRFRFPLTFVPTFHHQTTGDPTPPAPPPPAAPPAPRKIEFTQDEFDRVIGQRLDAERRRLEAQFGGPGALEELETLRREREERTRKEAEAKGNYDRALSSVNEKHEAERATWQTERKALQGRLRDELVRAKLVAAAAGRKAIKPEQIAALLDARVRLNDAHTDAEVLADGGGVAYVSGKPMTIEQLVAEFEADNPHLFAPADTGGAGSRGGASTSPEGAPSGTSREIATARAAVTAAREKAAASGNTADVTAVMQAERRLAALERAGRSA